jgi:tape measure domain-containing protein
MVERVVIEIVGDASKINETIVQLEKLGKVDKVNSDNFKKHNQQTQNALKKTGNDIGGLENQLNNLGAAIAGAFAVSSLVAFGKEAVQVSAKMDSITRSLDFITGSAKESQRTLEFLRSLSNRLGLEFTSTAQAFKQFAGAATQSGVSLSKSKTIFEQVSKAVTTMGLTAEDAQGVFLAMSQILSKGTVQAEELRGQIGERLPGAFAIAAKSIGVTEKQLNKMLEQGQVLSKDFLPKFAAQLEKDLGGGAESAANSTQAALNRLANSWNDFKNWFGSSIVAPIVEGAAKIVKAMNDATPQSKAKSAAMSDLQKEYDNYISKIEALQTAEEKYLKAGDLIAKMQADKKKAVKESAEARVLLQSEVDKQFGELRKQVLMTTLQTKGEEAYFNQLSIGGNKRVKQLVQLIRLNDEYGKGYDELIPKLQDYSESIINENKVTDQNTEKKNEKSKKVKDELGEYAELLKSVSLLEKSMRDTLALDGVISPEAIAQLDDLQFKIKSIEIALKNINDPALKNAGGKPLGINTPLPEQLPTGDFGAAAQKQQYDELLALHQDFLNDLESQDAYYEKKKQEQLDRELQAQESFYQMIPQFAAQSISIIAQYQSQAAEYELQVLNEKLAAKQISDKEYEKERRKILTKQAQDQKASAILQATIDIAGSIISTLRQFPGPYGIAMAAITAGLGAAQLAVIQSQKIPKFKKGTDYVALNGNPRGEDTIPALLNEGEAIIRTDENAKYPGLAKAWNEGKLDEHIFTKWVTPEIVLSKMMQAEAIDYDKLGQSVANSIKNNPQLKVSFDKAGFVTHLMKGNSTITYQNNRYSS